MLRGLFRTGRDARERDRGAAERIKAAARAALAPVEVELSVSEIECLDPACPGVETVILVMRAGARTRAVKIAGAMAEVGDEDVRAALAAADEKGSR